MATKGRERTITSSDLDIFGDVPENDSASATDASMDIFGSNEPDTGNEADVSTEGSATDEATETPAAESTEETAEPTAEEATETPATEALEEVEEQDIDIDKLFDDIEEQVKEE